MKVTFNNLFRNLLNTLSVFDTESQKIKTALLSGLSKQALPKGKQLMVYCDALLFLSSHPQNTKQLSLAEKELQRVSNFLKEGKQGQQAVYENSGLPYSVIFTRFSHDCLAWLLEHKFKVHMDSISEEAPLGELLKLTLPLLERERTASGYQGEELFEALQIKPTQRLPFLVNEFTKFNDQPFLKDHLFESLDCYVKVEIGDKNLSKFYNKLATPSIFYHDQLLKKFDPRELLDKPLPPAFRLDDRQLQEAVDCIKNSLVLKYRETDPVSYMDQSSLRLFELERGITIAIYGMTPDRQLPIESYIGYTLFKNGFPAAYGGSWIFGHQALFGMNVFEAYRGGESAFMMCQLLRVYRQVFNVNYFEIEPYQFGKDNPEGIASGAYWFYYRLGFRSIDKKQMELAEKENLKIRSKKGYRSSHKTLEQLAESYIALNLGEHSSLTVGEISQKVTSFIDKNYRGHRGKAEKEITESFREKVGLNTTLNNQENETVKEMAFLATVLKINAPEKFDLLREMVHKKPANVYGYQKLLRQFLNGL